MGFRTKRRKGGRRRESPIKRLLDLAESDPEAFRHQAAGLARRLGTTVEDLYARVRRDPQEVKRAGLDALLRKGAGLLKRELGW